MATTTKEAAYLIAVATEEFIKKLTRAGQAQARREGRLTVQQKRSLFVLSVYAPVSIDLNSIRPVAIVVKQNEGLSFLEDISPRSMPTTIALEKMEKSYNSNLRRL